LDNVIHGWRAALSYMKKKVEGDGVAFAPDPFVPFTNTLAKSLEPQQTLLDRETLTGQRLVDVKTRPGIVGKFSVREITPSGWNRDEEQERLVRIVGESTA